MMLNTLSPFLRRVLVADATVCLATGLLFFLGSGLLVGLMQLPEAILRPAGLFLIPYALLVGFVATRVSAPRWAVWAIIVANGLWAVESIVMLVGGWLTPNALGYAFVIAQAVIVAGFAEAQYVGLLQRVKAVA